MGTQRAGSPSGRFRGAMTREVASATRGAGPRQAFTQVVITNFLMPELTGREIAEAIQGAGGFTTPIVPISGSAEEPDERRAAETGLLTSVC